MGMYSETDFDMRTKLLRLSGSLAAHDITTLVITEAQSADVGTTVFPPETFMFDGVLTLRLDTDSQERKISIRKMRGTKHVIGAYRFDINDDGIVVIPG
jgi:KaiC/GvpD/RAD55 family RecA-like ATPase